MKEGKSMNGKPTIKDTYTLAMVLKTEIRYLKKDVANFGRELAKHCTEHRRVWLWIVPTLLMLADIIFHAVKG